MLIPNEVDYGLLSWVRDCRARGDRGRNAIRDWIDQGSRDPREVFERAARVQAVLPYVAEERQMPDAQPTDWKRIASETNRFLKNLARDRELLGAINWADLRVTDIEARRSLLDGTARTVVMIEEADSPELRAAVMTWISQRGYGNLIDDVEVEW